MQIHSSATPSSERSDAPGLLGNGSNDMRQMFTKLLVAQVRNQDPLNPTDPSQFISQLTQLSQAETLQSVGKKIEANTATLNDLRGFAVGAQVGADVSIQGGHADIVAGQSLRGVAQLGSAASDVKLVLTDASGQSRTVPLGSRGTGEMDIAVDAKTLVGQQVGLGRHRVHLMADGQEVPVEIIGTVRSVRFAEGGRVWLDVSGVAGDVAFHQIQSLRGVARGEKNVRSTT